MAAGCVPVPSLIAWKAARLLKGELSRPSPAAALLSMNQMIPEMGNETVPVALPPALVIVYVNESLPV